jgi:glutathione S-transferase
MAIKLHVFPLSPRAFKVIAVARYLDLACESCVIDLSKGEHKTPAFTSLNPNQKMPVLQDGDFALWESNAIMHYLAGKRPESGLLPADAAQRALVLQWQFWDMAHWDPACATLILENIIKRVIRDAPPDPARVEDGVQRVQPLLKVLNDHLANRRFMLGDSVTLADFSLGAALNLSQSAAIPVTSHPNVMSWYARLTDLPGWRESMVVPPGNALT